ncbi:MAG: glycosyltransferase family 25 protein, partial [Acinetobacter sp.]
MAEESREVSKIMQKYVISLTTALERRQHIQKEFAKKEVDFQFFDAVTPVAALSLVKEMHLNYSEMYLTQNELACFMSHVCLWKKIV